MNHKWQQFLSLVISLGLLMQSLTPLGLRPVGATSPTAEVEAVIPPDPDTPTRGATAVSSPSPLTISRIQSSYAAPGTVVITYTVRNTLQPLILPPAPASATITDTLAALDGFDPLHDPNTMRGVLLSTELTGLGTLTAVYPLADQQSNTLAWNLGDIAPMQSATAVVTLTLATSPANLQLLDNGAAAYGHTTGQLATAVAAPARVNPASFAPWLIWTLDADIYDTEMLAQAGQLGHDPDDLFAYVQSLGYELYDGSLRGTRGTLWSAAGNSADQSSLLIAMLRASGIPARYRHGALNTTDAQILLASMFPAPTQYVGHLEESLETADPVNDPALIAQAQDHWWVEAYLSGGWTDLDPSFPTAQIGDSFAAPASDGTDRLAELPDATRHKVTIRLKVEDYYPLNLGQSGLDYTYPLSHTFRTVELTAEPVAFSHLVHTENQGGLVFANTIHTYTPYLLLGDREIFGEPYQDILTNFPLGTLFHTAAWLQFDLTPPDGATVTYEREIVDKIGYETRVNGGNTNLNLSSDGSQFVTDFDIYATGFWPNVVPETAVTQSKAAALSQAQSLNADGQRLQELLALPSLTPAEQQEFGVLRARFQTNAARLLGNLSLSFAEMADRMITETSAGLFIKAYYAAPRLIITSLSPNGAQAAFSMDLRNTAVRTIPYPGQATSAAIGFNISKGFIESGIEGRVLGDAIGQPVLTTARIGTAAQEQDIEPVYLASDNLHLLDQLNLTPQAKARITSATAAGKLVIIPAAKVQIDGSLHTGWWEIDTATGETIGVLEDGLHGALEYLFTIAFQVVDGPLADFMLGFTAYTWGFVADRFDKAVGDGSFDQASYDWWIGTYATTLTCVGAIATGGTAAGIFCGTGMGGAATGIAADPFAWGQKAAEAYLNSVVDYDPPLGSVWMALDTFTPAAHHVATATLPITATLPAGNLAANITTDFTVVSGTLSASYASPGAAYRYDALSVSDGDLQDGNGAAIGSGAITAESGALTASAANVVLSGPGQMAFYAAALPALGNGVHFADAQAILSGNNLEMTLPQTAATLNDITYTGDFTIQTQSATLTGSGPLVAANHASSAALNGSNLAVTIGAASGTATLNGQTLDASGGLALASYSGAVTIADSGSQQVMLNGAASLFTLAANPSTSTATPETAVSFTPAIASNFAADFALTLTAPHGWTAIWDGYQATITPASGAAVGDYAVTVTACPESAPLVCQTAVHTVTVQPFDAFTLAVQPDLLTTMPMGNVLADNVRPGSTNSGQAQVPGAAYTIVLTNTANTAHTYNFSVAGLPASWTLLANRNQGETNSSLTLPPGETGYLGLYVNPTGGQLPAPGTSHTIQVTAVSDATAQQTADVTFTMPAVPFNYVTVQPPVLYLTSTASAEIDLGITNVGNVAGDFPVSARDAFDAIAVATPLSAANGLAPGATQTQAVTIASSDAPVGSVYPIFFDSPAPGGVYTQTATLIVQITSQRAGQIFQADRCSAGNAGYPASVRGLGTAVQELESWCELGDCPLPLRDNVVTAAQEAATYGGQIRYTTAALDVTAAAGQLASAGDDAAILAALDGLATAVASQGDQVCEVEEHHPALRWNPFVSAILSGDSVSYDLELSNLGTVETTYAVTLTLPTGQTAQSVTVPAGGTTILPVPVNAPPDGYHLLDAVAVPTGPDVALFMNPGVQARLNVVDKFVQVTAVSADPPFVDTGISATTLSVEIANVANVARNVLAETAVLAPNGSTQTTLTPTLNLLSGNPRTYELGTINTSGWAEGVYTVTVNLLDESSDLAPDGSGYGYLGVGQSLTAQMSSAPLLVPPGTVTVTTVITTALNNGPVTANPGQFAGYTIYDAPYWHVDQTSNRQSPIANKEATAVGSPPQPASEVIEDPLLAAVVEVARPLTYTPEEGGSLVNDQSPMINEESGSLTGPLTPENLLLTIDNKFFRIEQDDPAIAYTGSWSSHSLAKASGGSYWRNSVAGSTAVYTFTGSWLNLSFIGSNAGGYVDITIDGSSQGTFDLYRNEDNTPISLVLPVLGPGPHTVTMTVSGSSNPFSLGTRVQLDTIDTWDGTPLGDGTFEETAERVLRSGGWTDVAYAGASGGGYMRGSAATAWIPFDGDSFTYQALAYNQGGWTQLYVDGVYLDAINLYHPNIAGSAITRTFSYEGFGPGSHLLQIHTYRGTTTLDAFTTPGSGPFIDPNPAPASINRYEEDHPAILYNGVPYTQTAQTWGRYGQTGASDSQYIRSATANDVISFNFSGSWVNLGFFADRVSGQAEVFIDGQSQGALDLYRREDKAVSRFFGDLINASHTVSVTVLGSSNPFASGSRIQLDFIDFGDGTGLGDGIFEEDNGRIYLSDGWATESGASASGGSFVRHSDGNAWFHFSGDSFTYHALAYNQGNWTQLAVDGVYLDSVNLFHPNILSNAITRTFSYDGFGPGPHVLQISSYRGTTSLDALTTPGAAPFIDPNPPVSGVTRFEEDHPAIRYNGVPYTQTAQSWARVSGIFSNRASDGQHIYSAAAGDTISFEFSGSWIGVGLNTDNVGGQVEIAIDGQPVQTVDLYTRFGDTAGYTFDGLGAGSHTITITLLGTSHPNATGSRVFLDFFDVWDGQPLPDGTFEEDDARLFYSAGWGQTTDTGASGGSYATAGDSNSTAWFPFSGDSITFQTWTRPNYHSIELRVDGVSLGQFEVYSLNPGPRAFSFAGFGDGPHVLEVRHYRGVTTVDAFTTPATGAPYEPPTVSGVIRLEEDHPDLRYNGYPYSTMPQNWNTQSSINQGSGTYNNTTSAAGNTLSLDFSGTWVGAGFVDGGVVEIFIDGASRGTFDTSTTGTVSSVYFNDLISGTHTISITAVSGALRPDFIDIWDGQPITDGWYDSDLDETDGRFHYSNKAYWNQGSNQYAYDGDYLVPGLPNISVNHWFTFVGDDLTLLAFNRNNSGFDVTIDGQFVEQIDLTAAYSDQPIAFHYPDLGDGPHVVQIRNLGNVSRIDAFEVNPAGFYSYTPQVTWHDDSATDELDPSLGTGILSTIALGDLDNDGVVELVAPAQNGRLYVYRGDGQDVGDGTPIQWFTDLVGQAAEPALGDLDGDGNAEIIVSGDNGTFAFHHDGALMWQEPTIQAHSADGGGSFGWGGPTLGNLDNDADPEIVIAASEDALYVLDHLGNILDSDPIGRWPSVPVLADITGDGALDIIAAQDHTLKLYAYSPLNGLEIAWTYTLTNTTLRSGVFGSPAVADLTGDGQPEIIINWGHRVEALQADGSLLWSYYTGSDSHFRPSPITVADVTGDGQPNIVTASAVNAGFLIFDHLLMVLTKEGTLVWEQTVADSSASASGVAAQDLTGNGAWEILWNGLDDGFLVIRGSDGKRLFNEPFTRSGTIMDYPSMGDVDGDGVADVVVAGREGIFVISHVGHWVDSRPVWNQHNYHVTNVNDDWSIPFTQPNSWQLHNTYRTQTPERSPAPAYSVNVHYTAGIDQITVLTPTISLTPTAVSPPTYTFSYRQEWYQPVVSITLETVVADLQPGETRQVAQGALVTYTLSGGQNSLTLPPLYVTGTVIAELGPTEQTAVPGQTISYTLTLVNPGAADDTYTLGLSGLPADWGVALPGSANVSGNGETTVTLALTVPENADLRDYPFIVGVETGSGGMVQLGGTAVVQQGVAVTVTAVAGSLAPLGQPISHTLTITNPENVGRTYALSAAGAPAVSLPPTVAVPANSSAAVPFTAAPTNTGARAFTVAATAVENGATGSATAVITGLGAAGVAVTLTPPIVETGPGGTAVLTVTLQNLGSSARTFDLDSTLPAGWNGRFQANGQAVEEVFVATGVYNTAQVTLLVNPAATAVAGSYPISVTAAAQGNSAVNGSADGQIDLNGVGVRVEILDQDMTINPDETFSWDVRLTNTGANSDTFTLTAAGLPVGAAGAFSSESVTLAAGAATVVQYTAGPFTGALPQVYGLSVEARSGENTAVLGNDRTAFTLVAQEGVAVAWLPPSQNISNTFAANFTLALTNTGNIATTYSLTLSGAGLALAEVPAEILLPPGMSARIPVAVLANGPGEFVLTGTALGNAVQASETAVLWVEIAVSPANKAVYLPIIVR